MAAKMDEFEMLREKVETEGGLYATSMEELREAAGFSKLGVHVRAAISDRLLEAGMGFFPEDLPTYSYEEVRLYRLGSNIAHTVRAVLHPTDKGDDVLRTSAGSDANALLKQIRELVCE